MRFSARLLFASFLTALTIHFAASSASAQPKLDRTKPHYQVFVVDVSSSMITYFWAKSGGKDVFVPPSDPKGIRWDGLQFAIDISPPSDRIALVLFCADAHVITDRFSPDGFIHLGKFDYSLDGKETDGRTLLKKLITELQNSEGKIVKNNESIKYPKSAEEYELLRKEGEVEFKKRWRDLGVFKSYRNATFTPGTSVVKALELVQEQLMKGIPPDCPSWTLVLTDGQEEFDDQDKSAYFNELQKAKQISEQTQRTRILDDLTAKWTTNLNDNKGGRIPIISFALGKYCDNELLDSLGRTSNPRGFRDRGTSYSIPTNWEMLKELREIIWGIRQTWQVLSTSVGRNGKFDVYQIPRLADWDDVGLLLYRKHTDGVHAPQGVDPLYLGKFYLNPLKSRSHWYYHLKEEAVRSQAPLDKTAELSMLKATEGANEAVLAFRPKFPLFTMTSPKDPFQYYPYETIRFEFEFTPPNRQDFKADDFQIDVMLTSVAEFNGLPQNAEIVIKPDNKSAFYKDHVMDKNRRPVLGTYYLDATIKCTDGILKGGTLKLPRRTIEILDYPALKDLPRDITLSNVSAKASSQEIKLKLPLKVEAPTSREIATLAVKFAKSPNEEVPVLVAPGAVGISTKPMEVNAQGTFQARVDAKAWTKVPPGEKKPVGVITVAEPWNSDKPHEIQVNFDRKKYLLEATERLTFNLVGSTKKDEQVFNVALNTDLDAEEPVRLSAPNAGPQDIAPIKLELKPIGKAGTSVQADLTSPKLTARGGKGPKENVKLVLNTSDKLLDGVAYEGNVLLTGDGVLEKPISVVVRRNLLVLNQPADLMFHLQGSKLQETKPLQPTMKSGDSVPVWLSAIDDPDKKASVWKKSYADVDLEIAGLGTPVATVAPGKKGEKPIHVKVSLNNKAGKTIPANTHAETLFLVGNGVASQAIKVLVRRTLFQLDSPARLEFTLYGTGGAGTQTIKPKLKKAEKDADPVWDGVEEDIQFVTVGDAPNKLKLIGKKTKFKFDAQIQDATKKVTLKGKDTGEVMLKLALPRDQVIPEDEYEGEASLEGQGINALPIKVVVHRKKFNIEIGANATTGLQFNSKGPDRPKPQTVSAQLKKISGVTPTEDEVVWLSSDKDAASISAQKARVARLTLKNGKITVDDRGQGVVRLAQADVLEVELDDTFPISKKFNGIFYLVGPGVHEEMVKVTIDRDKLPPTKPMDLVVALHGSAQSASTTLAAKLPPSPQAYTVSLLDGPKSSPKAGGKTPVKFTQGDNELTLDVAGLGEPVRVGGKEKADGNIAVTVHRQDRGEKFIKAGDYRAGLVLVGDAVGAQPVNLIVRRTLIQPQAAPAPQKFELWGSSGSKSATQSTNIQFSLTTTAKDVEETVWLSANENSTKPNDKEIALKLRPTKLAKNPDIEVNAQGLGKATSVRGPAVHKLSLELSLKSDVDVDDYETDIWLVGPGIEKTKIKVVVSRKKFKVTLGKNAPLPLSFDLFAAAAKPKSLMPALDTQFDTAAEKVWLSAVPEADQKKAGTMLRLISKKEAKEEIFLNATGLGQARTVRKEPLAKDDGFSLALSRNTAIKEGTYEGKVWIVGPGIEAKELEVVVRRNLLTLTAPKEVTFDFLSLSHKKPMGTELLKGVTIESKVAVAEMVRFGDNVLDAANGALEFQCISDDTKKPVLLRIGDFKKTYPIGGNGADVPLTLFADGPFGRDQAGEYSAVVHLIGDGIQPFPVEVKVWLDDIMIDAKGTVPHPMKLAYFGLAGGKIAPELAFRSPLPPKRPLVAVQKPAKGVPGKSHLAKIDDGSDRVPLTLTKTGVPDSIVIPASILEGRYAETMHFAIERQYRKTWETALTLEVQVKHFGVRPDPAEIKDGETLRLKFDPKKKQGAEASAIFHLVSKAPQQSPVRWDLSYGPESKVFGEPLAKERLNVHFKGQSVLDPKAPRDSVAYEGDAGKCMLTVTANTADLEPGLYRCKLRFDSTVVTTGQKGHAYELPVEVLVAGPRVIPPDDRLAGDEGQKVPLAINVWCYSCPPGTGRLIPYDKAGKAMAALDIENGDDESKPTSIKECRIHTFRLPVELAHAGVNRFEVAWPLLRPIGTKMEQSKEFKLQARGRIQTIDVRRLVRPVPEPVHVDQEVAFYVNAPADAGAAPVKLQIVPRKLNEGDVPAAPGSDDTVELTFKDGAYSGTYKFSKPGWHTVIHRPEGNAGLTLRPVQVLVAFDFRQSIELGEMYYDAGDLGGLFLNLIGQSTEQKNLENVVRLQNRHNSDCRFGVELLFPMTPADARSIRNMQPAELARLDWKAFDKTQHLEARLDGNQSTGQVEIKDNHQLAGTLRSGQELQVNAFVKLSEDAVEKHYRQREKHETLGYDNGMCLKVTLRWTEDGKEMTRVMLVPISIATSHAKGLNTFFNVLFFVGLGVLVLGGGWASKRYGLIDWLRGKMDKKPEPVAVQSQEAETVEEDGQDDLNKLRRDIDGD